MMIKSDVLLEIKGLVKSYPETKDQQLTILDAVDFSLYKEQSVAIVGNSGCGKSTFLEICATLLDYDNGTVLFEGEDISVLSDKKLCALRNKKMGFIFQDSLLLNDFSALENVMMAPLINGKKEKDARMNATRLLALVGLGNRMDHKNSQLSGGERQRVAIARALANTPEVLFADEPTGSLDEENAAMVEELLFSLVKEEKVALMLATHNLAFARRCDHLYRLHDKRLFQDA
ncbi:MAG: ABC transporter ATP-binding protein [Sphaerochaetaceae bacterium]